MWIKLPWDADDTVSQWTPVVGACVLLMVMLLLLFMLFLLLLRPHCVLMCRVTPLVVKQHIPEGFTFADDAQGHALQSRTHTYAHARAR